MVDQRALFERVIDVLNARAWGRLGDVFTDDYVEEYPQSGEIFRGLENARAVRANYPGTLLEHGLDAASARLAAEEGRWVVTPLYTIVRIEGSSDVGTAILRIQYPDGSTWWNVNVYQVRGDKVARNTAFFAPVFAPPEWRAPYRDEPGGAAPA